MKTPTLATLIMSCGLALATMGQADTPGADTAQPGSYMALSKMITPKSPDGPMTRASGALGDACESDADCGAGLCLGTSCQCASDDHCEDGQKCDLGSCIAQQ